MKKTYLFLLASFLPLLSLHADLIWQEPFAYANGAITITGTNESGSTNWFLHSGSVDDYVNQHRLEVSSSTTYLGLTSTRSGDVHRNFATASDSPYTNAQQVLYASFIVDFTNLPTAGGAYFAHFYVNNTTFTGKLWALTNGSVLPNTFRLGVTAAGSSPINLFPADLALNTPYQVVLGLNPTDAGSVDGNLPYADTVTLWVNPISPADSPVVSSDAFTPGTSIANAFAFRQASGFGGFLTVSNLVLATSFPEAFTNGVILSTNAVAPVIVSQPSATVSNFPGSSIALSAIANGQGLGALMYQWQKSDSPDNANPQDVPNPTGNSNILPFPSAQTTDSGYYTMIATTPYGLSVTSAVSQVSIIDGPFPPQFTAQPTSQKLYTGQSVVFSTTVIGPPSGGVPQFTWYSNNVAVTAGQVDSGYSSSYEIDNLTPANSATYKVAVSNAFGGILSGNAVLTVSNASVVSIAFLRTLVDPVNFQATNSTLPFQVTGVITTYTNLTSGNTASYYLQDGTAGINIFATFGSTFRPAQGDIVTFIGVLSNFSSGLELYADTVNRPYTSYMDLGPGILPAPKGIPLTITNAGYANMNTNIGGRYVQITDVYFGSNAGTVVTNGFITVTNGAGDEFSLWFSPQDLDTQQPLPAYASTVTGVMFGSMNPVAGVPNPNFAVAVTKFSDIVAATPPVVLGAAVSGGTITFTWSDASYTLHSATNLAGPWDPVAGAATGYVRAIDKAEPERFFRLSNP